MVVGELAISLGELIVVVGKMAINHFSITKWSA
jgi:hypothetical protein